MKYRSVSYLTGVVTADVVSALIEDLTNKSGRGTEPHKLMINSAGGDVAQGLRLAKHIREMPVAVHGEVVGQCSSIAIPVLQACALRKAMPDAKFHLHFLSHNATAMWLYAEELDIEKERDTYRFNRKQQQEEVIHYTQSRSNITRDEILKIMMGKGGNGTVLSAKQAFAYGIIDDVMLGRR